ncbi:MAG: leucine-rich repeat domain-containing protein [Kiritimatiellae bacterium]|nr:leucine-rich repeat domain-containing protein [Kiritimatiellia bacterium]
MNKMNLICTVAFSTIASAVVIAGPGGGNQPGGGGNQPGGNQPGGGSSATWTFDTFLASSTTTSGLIIREGIIIGYDSPTSATVTSTVTDIAEGALAGCTTLTGIDLSATSITEIPESAFAGCSNLTTVILPSTCTTIGANAFAGCTKLATLTAPGVTTVGDDSFRACSALTKLPSTIVGAAGAFSFAQSGLTSVDLTSMTSVGAGAFAGCENLTAVTVTAGATLPDALFAGCTALDVGDWSGVAAFGQAALAEIPATTLTLSSSATLGAYALAADEATVVTTLSDSSVPTYDATAFLGREVSYTPEAGSIARLEAMALVTWLQEQAADSSSTVAQPTSYNTADLESWLNTASNLSAVYAFCWAAQYAADANFKPLAVEGTSFLLTAPDSGTTDSVSVSVVGTNDMADEVGFTADALAEAGTTDGVTTYVSSDATATSCFARLRFAKGW